MPVCLSLLFSSHFSSFFILFSNFPLLVLFYFCSQFPYFLSKNPPILLNPLNSFFINSLHFSLIFSRSSFYFFSQSRKITFFSPSFIINLRCFSSLPAFVLPYQSLPCLSHPLQLYQLYQHLLLVHLFPLKSCPSRPPSSSLSCLLRTLFLILICSLS